ncbi:MAG TPA: acetamidase/formamidase family protein [Thermomicrobiales bacterium]|nr:acetamidase/formamidase family protein [Thermomicrobiales bacterium]
MQTVSSRQHAFEFRPDIAPALRVRSGETVRFETSPEPAERLFAAGADWCAQVDTRRLNAVTGPVHIDGVEPGDAVRVDILEIETLDWGWNAFFPNFGMLCENLTTPMLRRVPIEEGRCWITDALFVPLRPMIGCLGLAPERGASSTLAPPFPWAGNYDLLQVKAGSTIWFPAQVKGGLFSLGDLHAAMGDGEATSVSIECAGAATVRLSADKQVDLQMPRIVSDGRLFTVGLAERGNYTSARRHAADQLFNYLTVERRLTAEDAYTLFSAAGDLSFGGPAGAVVLASIPLDVLDERDARARR